MLNNYSSWAERNGFADWALALGWIIIAFIGFQLTALFVFFILLAAIPALGGLLGIESWQSIIPEGSSGLEVIFQNFDLLFIGNSIGQILFLALATWFFCLLQTSKQKRSSFLRLKANNRTFLFTVIALLSVICIQPFVWFLGWLNSLLPAPELFQSLQSSQMGMLEGYITGENFTLLVLFHIAIVPAVCEEILFRGYVLRSFQKSWGYIIAIIVSGAIFGLFHLQLTHFLPLAAIGMLLGYLTWASESIIPAMAAHFLNNAGSVFLVRFYPNSEIASTSAVTLPPIWLIVTSVAITAYFLYFLYENHFQQSGINNHGITKSTKS